MVSEACVFCGIVKAQVPAKVVFDDNDIMAFNDVKPQAPVHVVIIPKCHIEGLSDVRDEEAGLMGRLMLTAKNIARDMKVDRSGYRLVLNCGRDAGQAVPHIHLHLLGARPMAWPPG